MTGVEAFMISRDKAEALAKAIAGVQKHFGLKVDGPTASIVKLVLVGGWVNAPILFQLAAINAAKRQQRAKPAAAPSTVEEATLAETGVNGERPRYRFQ